MTADSAATETTDELVEILAEAIYAARGYAGISKTDTGETRSVWASSLDYADAAMPVLAGWVRQQQAAAREAIAAQIHSIGGTALGVYTDDYQDGLTHATLTVLTGNTKHPNRYTPEERAQMFGLLNDLNRRAYSAATEPKDAGA
jgi:hypothetical protein